MEYLIDSIEGYKVRETNYGLNVSDKDDNFVCELEGCTMDDFKDELGWIVEDELYNAIREHEDLNKTMTDLAEMNTL